LRGRNADRGDYPDPQKEKSSILGHNSSGSAPQPTLSSSCRMATLQ
jgi:hypothetical protein